MATYVNDLRLKEIATGDESGTWGTSTNTNLELIAEAFSFGTEAITTNADTHTTTIADGSTDPGRSIYLKYTGALDSDCTITIGPNTVSKLWFIENATTDSGSSGPYNIIISQGSGANITIPNSHVKAIYSDGAGSGAAMVDAFTDLNLAGTTTVDDLTVSDDLTVTDDATIGGTLGVTGAVTANAGVSIDNITIDGTEIDLSSGDLTIDVAGGINLDSDGGEISFKDAGTEIGKLSNSSSDFVIEAGVQDKDILLKGNDGGSGITALTLDMSAAGAATFNGVVTADAGVKIDNITIDGTTASLSGSADLTIDVGGRIDLSADDNGEVRLYDGSSLYAQFKDDDDRLSIQGKIADKDMLFTVIDGSSEVTALRIDAADAGSAYFNNKVGVKTTSPSNNLEIFTDAGDEGLTIESTGNTSNAIIFDANRSGAGSSIGEMQSKWNGTTVAMISSVTGSDTTNKDDGQLIFYTSSANNLSERARLTTNGSLFIATSSEPNGSTGGAGFSIDNNDRANFICATTGTGSLELIEFRNPNGTVGDIKSSGTSTSYNTSSDGRLKDVTGKARGLEVINELNPVAYNWKADNKAGEGLIAQEVKDLVPDAVSLNEGTQYYQMDYSKLVVHLIAGMKEQQEQIDALQSEINILKGK